MRFFELEGTPRTMGESFGEAARAEIAELYEIRLRNALAQARLYGAKRANEGDLLALAHRCLAPWEGFDPVGLEELRGIARGSEISAEQAVALVGLTDLRDALAWETTDPGECTAFLVQRDATADGRLRMGQTWDLSTDNGPFVCAVHRRPKGGPETFCVTTVGGLALMGLSEAGVAVGTTNLRTRDARAGVPYVGVLHRMLASPSFEGALCAARGAPRAGGHAFLLASDEGSIAVVECSAERSEVLRLEAGVHAHSNHCLLPSIAAREADTPRASSEARRARMQELLVRGSGRLDDAQLQGFLADEHGGKLGICRDDFEGISTNAAWVVRPEAGQALVCAGLPSVAEWVPLRGDRPVS